MKKLALAIAAVGLSAIAASAQPDPGCAPFIRISWWYPPEGQKVCVAENWHPSWKIFARFDVAPRR
jgi:hypothetical protein